MMSPGSDDPSDAPSGGRGGRRDRGSGVYSRSSKMHAPLTTSSKHTERLAHILDDLAIRLFLLSTFSFFSHLFFLIFFFFFSIISGEASADGESEPGVPGSQAQHRQADRTPTAAQEETGRAEDAQCPTPPIWHFVKKKKKKTKEKSFCLKR